MSEKLIQLNRFSQGENRVWFDAEKGDVDFGYSDGQEIEHRLREILSSATDLSHTSYELKAHITDWPTEYHLTPVRSNLIRALDLTGVKRVLELGCGCGSITRYLGDYRHADGSTLTVDSVEGSPVRAELAALRCRDLDHVDVSTANFNEIDFPENYYDLVLYVGVTEYAGRFSERETDEAALQDLLALAKNAATSDGVVMVAIENRTGMKYVEGANEDHYAKPFIGIHNYAQPAGIRTYTKKEWQAQIKEAGFAEREFIYPFPDYKVPTIFLGEQYVDENPYSHNHLEMCRSRDYVKDFHYASKEALFWESTAASKTMGDYANSFMILMSNSAQSIAAMSQNDFLHLPSYQRKLEFCMSIAKPKDQSYIVRDYIHDDRDARNKVAKEVVHRRIEKEPFFLGPMLSVEWSRSLISYPDLGVFENYLRDYYAFLQQCQLDGKLTIDLLPNNIILTNDGKNYHVVDEEWQIENALNADYIYFRAILFFYMAYPDFVEEKAIPERYRQTYTLEDWLRYGFQVIGQHLSLENLLAFANDNEVFQNHISWAPFKVNFSTLLDKSTHMMALSWDTSLEDNEGSVQNSVAIAGKGFNARETLHYVLPASVRSLSTLTFFPCGEGVVHDYSFFRVYHVSLVAVGAKGVDRTLWELDSESTVSRHAILKDMVFERGDLGEGFYSHQYYPRLQWSCENTAFDLQADESLAVRIDVRFPITGTAQVLLERSKHVLPLEFKLTELDQIKASKSYALALKISKVAGYLRSVKTALKGKKKDLTNRLRAQWCSTAAQIPIEQPLVSIIIPFRDEPALLDTCIRTIVEKTRYRHYEIIAVSNDSVLAETERVRQQLLLDCPQCTFIDFNIPFNFSALVNKGVEAAGGDYVVLLNNDVEISSPDWLDSLLRQSLLEDVGVVGGHLSFPDGRIQHLGLHIGQGDLPEHSYKERWPYEFGLGSYLRKPRYVTAVTGAMLMTSKKLWNQLNGFDEHNFAIAFNDVDFCLRAIEAGKQNVIDPRVKAVHHESVSRGYETTVNKMRRFENEQTAFVQRHHDFVHQGDPYYVT